MALMNRVEYERELMELERRQSVVNGMVVAGTLDGFEHLQVTGILEEAKRQLFNKLVGARLVLGDREKTGKSPLFAWVIRMDQQDGVWLPTSTKKPPLLRHIHHTGGKWRETDELEVNGLQRRGVTIIPSRFHQKQQQTMDRGEAEEYHPPKWVDVPREVAQDMQECGEMVWWDKDGIVRDGVVGPQGETAKVKEDVLLDWGVDLEGLCTD